MKLLEPIRKREQRSNLGDYLSWMLETFTVGGNTYTLPIQTTWTGQKAEPISDTLTGYVQGGLKANAVVFGLERVRVSVFSQGWFAFQALRQGQPAELFSTPALEILRRPWPGGSTTELLTMMLLDADMAGNAYWTRVGNQLVRLRPDWVEVVLGDRIGGVGDYEKVGYFYYHGGKGPGGAEPVPFRVDEVAHFKILSDPVFRDRGISWLTPVIREIQADSAATSHKLKFFENAATPNLAVSFPQEVTPEQFESFVEKMGDAHDGYQNAYKTLYTAGGADVTVIGADLRQLDFKVTQGAGETRLALAAGVPPTVACLSEGMQGAALNAGNFGQARRQFSDITLWDMWNRASSSLEVLVTPPSATRLTIDPRGIPLLQEDMKDAAAIMKERMLTIESAVRAGYTPDSATAAVDADDITLLKHTGLYSVQLQPPGTQTPAAPAETPPARSETREMAPSPIFNVVMPATPPPDVVVDVASPEVRLDVVPPVVNVNVSPTPVHVDAPAVTVENNVPVPDVHFEPNVSVPTPQITVPITVEEPDRKVTRKVIRDANGLITKVVEE